MASPIILGAIPHHAGTRFGAWAPEKTSVAVELDEGGTHPMLALGEGYFALDLAGVPVGARYWFAVDGGQRLPDLASRWQPDGSDGPSVVVGGDFAWTDQGWTGVERIDRVVYELHVGTFTGEGTWQAAAGKLTLLRAVGITVIQLMPVGTFKGSFGWGYDTTLPYAPFSPYGTPDDIRVFVDRAHALGIGVILDVVYNHPGSGDHYRAYSESFFTRCHENEWGASFNFDQPGSRAVRDFFIANAVYWIEAFHLDGLRIDAVQALFDASDEHILTEIVRAVRGAGGQRHTYVVVENQPQDRKMIEPPERGGPGVDAMYNDDFHHSVRVATTGHNGFYYQDYLGTPQEMVSALKHGFLYQGQRSKMRNQRYGTYNLDTRPEHFLHFLENHDQVANSARGLRLGALASPARVRAITGLLLLGPQTPCLFQGQEFGSSRPFLYFFGLDDAGEAQQVAAGRRASLRQFPNIGGDPVMQERLADPAARATFESCKLDWSEATRNAGMLALHTDLISLRRTNRAFSQATPRRIDGAVIGDHALLLRFITEDPAEHRLLLVNLGRDLPMGVMAEPLLAPGDGLRWALCWSSENPKYGGTGRHDADPDAATWVLPGDSALVLQGEAVQARGVHCASPRHAGANACFREKSGAA